MSIPSIRFDIEPCRKCCFLKIRSGLKCGFGARRIFKQRDELNVCEGRNTNPIGWSLSESGDKEARHSILKKQLAPMKNIDCIVMRQPGDANRFVGIDIGTRIKLMNSGPGCSTIQFRL